MLLICMYNKSIYITLQIEISEHSSRQVYYNYVEKLTSLLILIPVPIPEQAFGFALYYIHGKEREGYVNDPY